MAAGGLVSDDIVTAMVAERIAVADCLAGYVLDGYPRTIGQAEALAKIDGGRTELVLALETSVETLVGRLSGRIVCPSCQAVYNTVRKPPRRAGVCDACGGALVQRPDDAADVVRERIRVYEAATAPLKDYYRSRSDYREIDGEGSPQEVFARIAVVLDAAGAAAGKRAER
jgi:adenylate kinase